MFTENVAKSLVENIGTIPYFVLVFAVGLIVPMFLLVAVVRLINNPKFGVRTGMLLGLGVATWASLCWVIVPYVGAYPSLPGVMAAITLSAVPPVDTVAEEVVVHAVNFVFWPMFGGLLFFRMAFADSSSAAGGRTNVDGR